MGQIVDIGKRIELVPMDPHFHDITIALYQQGQDESPLFLVHTYSRMEGAQGRIQFAIETMTHLGNLVEDTNRLLRFPCEAAHQLACRRAFLESCKLSPNDSVEPRPLHILDKKSGLTITVTSLGDGIYQVTADGEGRRADRRISAIAGGLIKLGEMDEVDGTLDKVAFPCGHSHDALLGLLLIRAPNVRAIVREQEMAATRGILAAPSQQN
jgi:hypothetical protein